MSRPNGWNRSQSSWETRNKSRSGILGVHGKVLVVASEVSREFFGFLDLVAVGSGASPKARSRGCPTSRALAVASWNGRQRIHRTVSLGTMIDQINKEGRYYSVWACGFCSLGSVRVNLLFMAGVVPFSDYY